MNSTPSPDQTDLRNVAIAALKEACKQIGPGDDQLVGLKEQVSKLEQDAAGFRPAEACCCPAPPVIARQTGFTVAHRLGSVASLSVAAFAWQSYGDAAKQAIARCGCSTNEKVAWEPKDNGSGSCRPRLRCPRNPMMPLLRRGQLRPIQGI